MNEKPLVSIVIPVFNVDKYLDDCLGSVNEQSYSNIEVVMVDDGSTDRSGIKCDNWAEIDERIKVVHKTNQGLNYARRDGFKASTGEFIMFLDSDDLLHRDCIKISLEAINYNKAHAVVFATSDFDDKTREIKTLLHNKHKDQELVILDTKHSIIRYAILGEPNFPDSYYMTAWGKLYKREIIEGLNWQKSNFRSYEDLFWTTGVLARSDKIILISNNLHFYRRNIKYGLSGDTLGNRLTGNTYNGKPVGYLEYLEILNSYYQRLSQAYDIDIERELKEVIYKQMTSRIRVLIENNLISAENNTTYLKGFLALQESIYSEQRSNIEVINKRLNKCDSEINRLKDELASFNGIRSTLQKLLENIKRRANGS
jgi:glycosyltransferase involved in cell wall biosynthesis